jgi:tetratricopeptide (TPR) repeat protein
MQFYSDWGKRIAAGQWTDGRAFYGLPGYAYVLGTIYALIGFDPFSVGLIQAVWFATVAVLLHALASEVFQNKTTVSARSIGWIAAAGWIAFVPAQTFAAVLMPTVWLVAAYWALILWLIKTRPTPSLWRWAGIGLGVGSVSMLIATITLLSPLVLIRILQIHRFSAENPAGKSWLRALAAAGLYGIGLFAGSAPATLHNYLVAREPVLLSAHSGINFWIGNNPEANGYPRIPAGLRATQEGLLQDSIRVAEKEAGRPLTRAEVSAHWTAKARTYIRSHFGVWCRLLLQKIANFWNAYTYDDICCIKLFQDRGITLPGLGYGQVAALALAGVGFALRLHPRAWWPAGAILLHLAALLPVFVTERYRLAAVPGLLLFAAWWGVALTQHLRYARWKSAALFVGAAGFAAWFVSIPRKDPSLWSLDFYKAGIRQIDSGETAQAAQNLRIALRYAPGSPEIHFALGNLALKTGQRDAAKAFYFTTLTLQPFHSRAHNNLGVLALEDRNWPEAEKRFITTLKLEPEDAKAFYLLALAQEGAGNFSAARESIAAALRLRPGQRDFLALEERLRAR